MASAGSIYKVLGLFGCGPYTCRERDRVCPRVIEERECF